jgi:hypothetical protein
MDPTGCVEHESANCPDDDQRYPYNDAEIHELTGCAVVCKLTTYSTEATLGTENSVFEPTSPSGGFDNLSPTSCPQCGGRRKVGGEDLIHSTGLHKTLSGPNLRAPWLIPRGSFVVRSSPSLITTHGYAPGTTSHDHPSIDV